MMDKKDFEIIEQLKADSRASIKKISQKTKLRPSTVHKRIEKLKGKKIIESFTIRLNDKEVGESFIVFMLVKGGTEEYIDNRFINNKNVKEVFGITGEYDLLIKLKFGNVEEFNDYILGFRKNNKNIASTLTMVATKKIKEEF
ncbi:MAG TPA: Lrp/AsnC family transcriptional regulator [Candidatus Nanoarchaeia archaeon]|nr:Lrp/AsnC family transcriptional regulator [Candidatus Nanoarchaeia archaeon]